MNQMKKLTKLHEILLYSLKYLIIQEVMLLAVKLLKRRNIKKSGASSISVSLRFT